MTDSAFEPLPFARGPAMKNRFVLSPLTNMQSHPDGRLSEEEHRWLQMRAAGGFGLTMTCATSVQAVGKGFQGQLGAFSDDHLEGLARLAGSIRAAGSVSAVQLHHAGSRAPAELVGQPVSSSDDAAGGVRALTTAEVEQLVEDFVAAAARVDRAGFDGVEIHGAHGYMLTQFLSPETNRRQDRYGGSLENRARIVFEVVDGARRRCRPDFQIGLRLSAERFGLRLGEMRDVAQELMDQGRVDYLDMSLWDYAKAPEDDGFKGRSLMSWFTDLRRGAVRLGVVGKIATASQAFEALSQGADFVLIGRAAILHHDFPDLAKRDRDFRAVATPVTPAYLHSQGVSPAFVDYIRSFKDFVTAS
ncbi:NADH:flavin oxidoreductase [Phenylobacterium sp.]|uniref:NADH:flavin oxidoreductase n=1 Tax=Phenylobacterium sp. TaxID=1871053 RepID=UPI002F403E56